MHAFLHFLLLQINMLHMLFENAFWKCYLNLKLRTLHAPAPATTLSTAYCFIKNHVQIVVDSSLPSLPSLPSLRFFRHVRHVSQLEVKRQAHMQEVMVAESWMPPMPVEERNFIAVNAAQNPASESVSQIEMKSQWNCTKSVRIRSTRKNHMLFYLTTEQHMHKDHPGSSPMSTEKSNFQ